MTASGKGRLLVFDVVTVYRCFPPLHQGLTPFVALESGDLNRWGHNLNLFFNPQIVKLRLG